MRAAVLLTDMVETSSPRPNTGSLAGDRREAADRFVARWPIRGRVDCSRRSLPPRRVIPMLHRHFRRFTTDASSNSVGSSPTPVARGEAPVGTDPATVLRHLSAPMYYRMLTGHGPPDQSDAARSTDAALPAIAAGVFTV